LWRVGEAPDMERGHDGAGWGGIEVPWQVTSTIAAGTDSFNGGARKNEWPTCVAR
jgi:hypothetical protein